MACCEAFLRRLSAQLASFPARTKGPSRMACRNHSRTPLHRAGHGHALAKPAAPRPAQRLRAIALRLSPVGMAVLCGIGVLVSTALLPATSSPAWAQQSSLSDTAERSYNIPAGALGTSLATFASQSGLLLSFDPSLTSGLSAPALTGNHTIRSGLEQLLVGSGLQLVAGSNGNYALRKTAVSSSAQAGTLPEVVVTAAAPDGSTEGTGSYTQTGPSSTATGLGLSLRDTPQSVSVMTRQRMDDFKLETLTDVLEQTPGIAVYRQNNATDFQARGTSVNVQTDGMSQVKSGWYYLTSTLFSLDDMAEVDRVEVLKGSSGLVVGKGEYGATVNMIRKRPTHEFQASVRASAGSWSMRRGQADISGSLNDAQTLRARVVASAMNSDGFRDGESSKSNMLYGTLEADLSPDTLLNVGVTYRQREAHGIGTTQSIQRYTRAGVEVPWTSRSFNTGAPWGGYKQDSVNLFGSIEQRLANDWAATLKFSHQRVTMGDMTAAFLYDQDRASYGKWIGMNNNNWTVNLDAKGPFSLFGREHKLLVGAGITRFHSSVGLPLNAQNIVPLADLGVDYAQGGGALPPLDTSSWQFGDNSFSQKQRYVYAAGLFQVTDPLKLVVGTRVTKFEERDITPYWWNYDMNESAVVTPYAGLIYEVHPQVSLYGSYANIFQPQTAQDEQGNTLAPEKGNTFEIGAKGEFLDKRLNASISHFWIKTNNTAEETGGLTPGGDAAYRAVSSATRHGWEMELSGELARGWQAQGSVVQQNSSLNSSSQYPKYQFKLGSTYRLSSGALNGLTVGAATRWQNKTSVSNANATLAQNAYWVLDLMARYEVDKHLSFSVNVNNALDKKYLAGMNNFTAIGLYYTWGAPRSVNVGMRYDF